MPVPLPAGFSLIAFDRIGSTNAEARRRAVQGAADGTIVWAGEQSGGRGRRGRHWASPAGNLYVSVILRPDRRLAEAAQLSLVTAVALSEALGEMLPGDVSVRCKWPNDVMVNGRKIAGILLESSGGADATEWVVIGCGVNVASHPESVDYPTTDLIAAGAAGASVEYVLQRFIECLAAWRVRWLDAGIEPVRAAWIAKAARLGETITVRLPNREISGRFVDMDSDGALLLQRPDGVTESITAGDVFFQDV